MSDTNYYTVSKYGHHTSPIIIGQLSNVSIGSRTPPKVKLNSDNKHEPGTRVRVSSFSSNRHRSIGYQDHQASDNRKRDYQEGDQLIPQFPSSSSPTKNATIRSHLPMTQVQTIQEHVEEEDVSNSVIIGSRCPSPSPSPSPSPPTPTPTFTSYQSGNTPDRPSDGRRLKRLVEQTYRDGNRSPHLASLAHRCTGPMAMKVATNIAEYVLRTWEGHLIVLQDNERSRTAFIHYVASLLFYSGSSPIIALIAAYYVGRLRKMFPRARGEVGCSHRLFTVSLLIATRYYQHHGPVQLPFYQQWSTFTNGIFSPSDLHRMELEFVAFLKFKLYVGLVEFEYFVDRILGDGMAEAQRVPQRGIHGEANSIDKEEFSRYTGLANNHNSHGNGDANNPRHRHRHHHHNHHHTNNNQRLTFDGDATVPSIVWEL